MSLSPAAWSVLDALTRIFVAWQVVWGLVAFVTVWRDKVLATGGRRRVPERTLHRAEVWGGWAGSLLAQRAFRHKSRKAAYQRVYRRIALAWLVVNAGIVALRIAVLT